MANIERRKSTDGTDRFRVKVRLRGHPAVSASFHGKKLVDDALFQHVQAHYTAAPVFTGMNDPFLRRSGLVQKAVDSVALVVPQPQPQPTIARPRAPVTTPRNAQAGSGFDYHLGQIGDHAGGDGFHGPIIRAIASYVAEHGTEGTDTELLYSTVRQRVLAADKVQSRRQLC